MTRSPRRAYPTRALWLARAVGTVLVALLCVALVVVWSL